MKYEPCNMKKIAAQLKKSPKNAQERQSLLEEIHALEVYTQNILKILDLIPTGIVIVNEELKPVLVNRYAEDVLNDNDGLSVSNGRISVSHAHTMRELKEALVEAMSSDDAKSCVLSVGRPSGAQSLMVLLVPLRKKFSAVFIADPGRKPQVQKSLIADLFGLTKMESAVAASVAQGQRLNEVAQNLNISLHTARSHLKHVFSKTGTDRQLELANQIGALLGKVWLEEEKKVGKSVPLLKDGERGKNGEDRTT